MTADQGPVVQSALLRSELVRLRRESGLTQEQVAEALEWSPSKLIRVEGGYSSITKVDLDALLTRYGVTSETTRERLQALNRYARERGWWDAYRDHISPTYLSYVGYEAGAAFIRQFQIGFIPSLLQTREYAEVMTAVGPTVSREEINAVVELRMQCQTELRKRSAQPCQYFVIDEAVIRRHVGISKEPAIMPNQLRSIADRAEKDELVKVRVIPFDAGAHAGLFGSFTLLEFGGGLADALYLDVGRGTFNVARGHDSQVSDYAAAFEELLKDVLTADKSIELIQSVAEEMS
jgi:transcriptional regulator with XRE-family HTH domain